jgi:predicted RNA-binding protein associated with RNAse of E/G family
MLARMTRHAGADIDTITRRVRDRDGLWYPLDRMVVADGGLFYSRPIGSSAEQHRVPGQLFHFHQRWILPKQGWVVNRMSYFPDVPEPMDWYIEPEIITVNGDTWRIRDSYLDVEVYDGLRYCVDDAGELAQGLRDGDISVREAAKALEALDQLCVSLKRLDFSGRALLAAYAHGLPAADEPS